VYALAMTLVALWCSQFYAPFIVYGPMLLLKLNERNFSEPDVESTEARIQYMLDNNCFQLQYPDGVPPMPDTLCSLVAMLTLTNPALRFNAAEALEHPWFKCDGNEEPSYEELAAFQQRWQELLSSSEVADQREEEFWGAVDRREQLIEKALRNQQQQHQQQHQQQQGVTQDTSEQAPTDNLSTPSTPTMAAPADQTPPEPCMGSHQTSPATKSPRASMASAAAGKLHACASVPASPATCARIDLAPL
jgi:serine/threonine protein kinase